MKKWLKVLCIVFGVSSLLNAGVPAPGPTGTTSALLGVNTNTGGYPGYTTLILVDQANIPAGLQVSTFTATGPSTLATVSATTITATGVTATNLTGTLGFIVPAVQSVSMAYSGAASTYTVPITPASSYIVLSPTTTISWGATPTISTSPTPGSASPAFADGTFLIVGSTSAATIVTLQDNGTLSGSRLYLNNSGLSTPVTGVLVSSTMTATFQYNASNTGWNLVR